MLRRPFNERNYFGPREMIGFRGSITPHSDVDGTSGFETHHVSPTMESSLKEHRRIGGILWNSAIKLAGAKNFGFLDGQLKKVKVLEVAAKLDNFEWNSKLPGGVNGRCVHHCRTVKTEE